MKKLFPFLLLVFLLTVTLLLRNCNNASFSFLKTDRKSQQTGKDTGIFQRSDLESVKSVFRDPASEFYFTKHARCRMRCRMITEGEVREIVQQAQVNVQKSDFTARRGPKYALEGYSAGQQHIRVILAPRKRHLTVVTVIDLDREHDCPSCEN